MLQEENNLKNPTLPSTMFESFESLSIWSNLWGI